jgi:hypothetical protein
VTPQNDTFQLLREALHAHVVQVQFLKSDGSVRIMQATLREAHLPTQSVTASHATPRVSSPHVCRVWDLDKQAWRSFRMDSIQSWQIISEHDES